MHPCAHRHRARGRVGCAGAGGRRPIIHVVIQLPIRIQIEVGALQRADGGVRVAQAKQIRDEHRRQRVHVHPEHDRQRAIRILERHVAAAQASVKQRRDLAQHVAKRGLWRGRAEDQRLVSAQIRRERGGRAVPQPQRRPKVARAGRARAGAGAGLRVGGAQRACAERRDRRIGARGARGAAVERTVGERHDVDEAGARVVAGRKGDGRGA